MNKKVKILFVLAFLFLIVLIGSYSYSKYRSDVTGEASTDVAKWNITVNGCNISKPDETDETCFASETNDTDGTVTILKNFSITEFSYGNSDLNNVEKDKIAPGSSGEFAIKIKPNDTEVSIKYTIHSHIDDDNVSLKYYIKGPHDSERHLFTDDGYVGYINYSEDNALYVEQVTFYVEWENDEDNNEKDTAIGTKSTNPTLDIPIEITFEQYNG